jgi:Na+/H+ antiporter NhaC
VGQPRRIEARQLETLLHLPDPGLARSSIRWLALLAALAWPGGTAAALELAAAVDGAALAHRPLHLEVTVVGLAAGDSVTVELTAAGRRAELTLTEGEQEVSVAALDLPAGRHRLRISGGGDATEVGLRVLPGWLSVLPPLIAIGLALVFKDVLISLFLGVYAGALILFEWRPFTAFARSIDGFIAPSLADGGNASIVVFTTLLGGMVGVIGRSGGTMGIVERLKPYASNPRRGQLATWALGVLIFFDDYANTLIVGNTMRPITDKLRISREKLAYIVDSTAAPVASIFPISTWIGYEIGLIGAAFAAIGLDWSPYAAFVASIPYRFYPLLALVLGFTIAATRKDLGAMHSAERRAATSGELVRAGDRPLFDPSSDRLAPPEGTPLRAVNALLPILTVIGVTLLGLYRTGAAGLERAAYDSEAAWLREVFAAADSYSALLWAALSGLTVALALALAQRLLSVRQAMEATVNGFQAMLLALTVLVLAWSIGSVCDQLHTADYVVGLIGDTLSPHWLPVLVFLLSALIAFATGSSWGTMAILMPIVIPISHHLSTGIGLSVGDPHYATLMLGTISSVLAGSIWGDHCSPISDTTILSSMASGCDHIAHVRTQMPYAIGIGLLGMLLGDIPSAYGLSPWVSLAVAAAIIVFVVVRFGKRPEPAG